jgi:hypothetical protein
MLAGPGYLASNGRMTYGILFQHMAGRTGENKEKHVTFLLILTAFNIP